MWLETRKLATMATDTSKYKLNREFTSERVWNMTEITLRLHAAGKGSQGVR